MLSIFLIQQIIYTFAWSWWILIATIALGGRMIRMGPFADIIIVTTVSLERRAFIISLSRVAWNSLSIAAPMVAAVIVTSFGGISTEGIRPPYLMQLTLCLIVFIYLSYSLPSTVGRIGRRDNNRLKLTSIFREYLDAIKGERYLKQWVIMRIIQSLGGSLAAPFYSLWLVEAKNADPYLLGTLSMVSLLTNTVLQLPAGWLADRIGRKKVFYMFQPLSYVGTLLAVTSSKTEHLILAAVLGSPIAGLGGLAGLAFPAFITLW
ncbi:MAG: MFS transporter [Thermoproteota archaeon]